MSEEAKGERVEIQKFLDGLAEEEKYVVEQLMKLCTINALSCKEDVILEYLKSEIESISEERKEKLEIVKDVKNYGLYTYVPSTHDVNEDDIRKTILFDAHVDQVAEEMMTPTLWKYREWVKSPKHLLNCTALDNRTSCAILLGLIKFCRDEHKRYVDFIALFSVKEEIGKKGIEYFAERIDLPSTHKKLKKISVLDVTSGITPSEKRMIKNPKSRKNKFPLLGSGMYQNVFANKMTGRDEDMSLKSMMDINLTNLEKFEGSRYYGRSEIRKTKMGVPVTGMHEVSSFCCIEDVLDLYRHIRKNIHML